MAQKSFRVGRVRAFLRGRVWYLSYSEQGRRRQPRVGRDRDEAKRLAAEINAQLEVGAPSALGFEPVSIIELRQRWLDHHEQWTDGDGEKWTEVLGSERLTGAALDRLTHRCHILETKGESYRLQQDAKRRRRTADRPADPRPTLEFIP
jgi:hypothetical protein